jgi:hypothetical protein
MPFSPGGKPIPGEPRSSDKWPRPKRGIGNGSNCGCAILACRFPIPPPFACRHGKRRRRGWRRSSGCWRRAAAEEVEIGWRPTGDPETDRLLTEIRADETRHAETIGALQRGAQRPSPPPRSSTEVQQRLDQLRSRETWHRSGTGWISGAIYGANDGLAAVFGIVAGVSGATGGSHFVLTAGLGGALATAL